MTVMPSESAPIAIIGAGPSGLAACKSLAERGVPVECLDARDRIGGLWNVEDAMGGGYRSLATNTSTNSMAFSDFPFPDDHPPYADATGLVRYFEAYADHFDLKRHIRLGRRVAQARPSEDGTWQLDFEGGEAKTYSGVVVATGQYSSPRRPHEEIPGTFAGEHLHVYDYLDPATPVECRDRRVIVVGLGSSAAELATELSDPNGTVGSAAHLIMSARSGRWVMPKLLGGRPADRGAPHPSQPLPSPIRYLPAEWGAWLMRRAFAAMLRRQWQRLGGGEALGLPEPAIAPWVTRPTLSEGFIPALQEGRIEVRPGLREFDGSTVRFTDGSETEADVIVWATGYQLDFPFFSEETLGGPAGDLSLYQRIAHPAHDGLFFVGICSVMCSLWPLAEQQSRWIARHLSGGFALPGRAVRARKAVELKSTLPVMCNAYVSTLRREAGSL